MRNISRLWSVFWVGGLLVASIAAAQEIQFVSVNAKGEQANDWCYLTENGAAAVSEDGRFITFRSNATNLDANDADFGSDQFLYDSLSNTVESVSVTDSGADGTGSSGSISADASVIAFTSADALDEDFADSNNEGDVYYRIPADDETAIASLAQDGTLGNSDSFESAISADGSVIAFTSFATDLIGIDTVSAANIYRRVLSAGGTEIRITNGGQSGGPSISGDGTIVAFWSDLDDLVELDGNQAIDVFVYNHATEEISRASVSSDETEANGASQDPYVSESGRYVAFRSKATNLVAEDDDNFNDIFVRDLISGETVLVNRTTSGEPLGLVSCFSPSLSQLGRFVTYTCAASLETGGSLGSDRDQVILYDRDTGSTRYVSLSTAGGISNNRSLSSKVVYSEFYGLSVAFDSFASNIVVPDLNGRDVFVYREAGEGILRSNFGG